MLGSDYLQDSCLGVPLPFPMSDGHEEVVVYSSWGERQAATWSGAAGIGVSGVRKSGFAYARYKNAILAHSYKYGQGV